jgi:drug/metabolite transporter (DMT)-like permease
LSDVWSRWHLISPISSVPPFPWAGEILSLTAAVIWAGSTCLYKAWAKDLPAGVINLYKNTVAMVLLFVTMLVTGTDMLTEPWVIFLLAISGVIGIALGDNAFFAALPRLGAQVTSAIQCLAPPLTAALAFIALGEALDSFEMMGMLMATIGVAGAVWFSQQGSTFHAGWLLGGIGAALLAALCQAVGLVLSRQAIQQVSVLEGSLLRITPAVIVLLLMSSVRGRPVGLRQIWSSKSRGMWLTFAAFCGTCLGLLLSSAGVKYTKAGIAAALSSTYPVFVIPLAAVFLGEATTTRSKVCTVIAVVGVAVMLVGR